MSIRVYITGMGIISALGDGITETLANLQNSSTGIDKITLLSTKHAENLPGGEVKLSNEALLEKLERLKGGKTHSRTALLAMVAAQEAAHMAQWHHTKARSAVVSATSVGGMDQGEIFYQDFLKDKPSARLALAKTHDCGNHTEQIAELLQIEAYIATTSTACSSALNALIHGVRLIKHGGFERVIVGGTDAYSRFTINGFNALMILSDTPSQPFDKNRKGLNLGEGAGYLVLESEDLIARYPKKPLAEVKGYGNACDAYHQTASSPEGEGAYMSMKQALDKSLLSTEAIDYINTHGTGTVNNDLSESIAMQRLFQGKVPPFSSTKSATGHTLAASGGIEAIFSILAIQEHLLLPNLNFQEKMEEVNISPQTVLLKNQKVDHVLSNSFGFGGNNSSVIFARC